MLVCLLGEILERASPTSCGHTPPTPTRLLQPLVAPCTEPQAPLFFCSSNVCHAPSLQQAVCWGRTGQKCTGQSLSPRSREQREKKAWCCAVLWAARVTQIHAPRRGVGGRCSQGIPSSGASHLLD